MVCSGKGHSSALRINELPSHKKTQRCTLLSEVSHSGKASDFVVLVVGHSGKGNSAGKRSVVPGVWEEGRKASKGVRVFRAA